MGARISATILSRVQSNDEVGRDVMLSTSTQSNVIESPPGTFETLVKGHVAGTAPGKLGVAVMVGRAMGRGESHEWQAGYDGEEFGQHKTTGLRSVGVKRETGVGRDGSC